MATNTTRKDEAENIKKQEEMISDIRKDLFTLANYYFVFQGVIFTAVFNSPTALKCRYRWLPITLSLIAGLLNFTALFQISQKYLELLKRQDIDLKLFVSNERERNRRPSILGGSGSAVSPQGQEQQNDVEVGADLGSHKCRNFILFLCMSLFLGFIAVNVIASALILCQENQCNNYYGRSTCLNLCDQEKCVIVCPQH